MGQKRLYDFGDPVVSLDDDFTRQYLLPAGVYDGFSLGVDTYADLTFAAGVGLQPDGIVWQEDASTTLDFSSPPAVATDYSVVATHDNRQITGGIAVEYEIRVGLVSSLTDGVVLGWIHHPGGGIPLATTHLVDAPKMKATTYGPLLVAMAPQYLYAPLPRTYSDVAGMGANVVFTGQTATDLLFDTTFFVNHHRVTKTVGPAVPETFTQHVQFWMDQYRPAQFDFYVNIPGGATLTLQLRDTDLNIVTITGSPITTTTDWETASILVDRNSGTFDTGKPYELRLTYSVDVGQQIDLARITAHFWPFPV